MVHRLTGADEYERELMAIPKKVLDDNSAYSGKGDQKGYMLGIYYERKHESKIIQACKRAGVDITKMEDGSKLEATPVDLDSPFEFEQTLMMMPGPVFYMDMMEREIVMDEEPPPKPVEPVVWRLPIGLLFPSTGSQSLTMLNEVKDDAKVKEMLAQAKEILGYDILELCLNGPEDKLAQEKYCQPAMYVAGLAAMAKLMNTEPQKVKRCSAVAGPSLGEYTALAAAGVYDFGEGLKLVKIRAEAMQETSEKGVPQGLLSVAGVEQAKLEELCAQAASGDEICSISNHLFPNGWMVGGSVSALKKLEPLVKPHAIQVRLSTASGVAGAAHTSAMKPVQETLAAALKALLPSMKPPRCHVYMNLNGQAIKAGTKPETIVSMLEEQMLKPVLWEPTMKAMLSDGLKEFYELGPGKQLKAMMKRVDNDAWQATTNVSV